MCIRDSYKCIVPQGTIIDSDIPNIPSIPGVVQTFSDSEVVLYFIPKNITGQVLLPGDGDGTGLR